MFFTNSETNTTLTNKQSHFSESDDLDELLTSHPAKKNVMNFMRVIIVDSLSLLSSPKVVTICIRMLEFCAISRDSHLLETDDFYHIMIAFFTQNDLNRKYEVSSERMCMMFFFSISKIEGTYVLRYKAC